MEGSFNAEENANRKPMVNASVCLITSKTLETEAGEGENELNI